MPIGFTKAHVYRSRITHVNILKKFIQSNIITACDWKSLQSFGKRTCMCVWPVCMWSTFLLGLDKEYPHPWSQIVIVFLFQIRRICSHFGGNEAEQMKRIITPAIANHPAKIATDHPTKARNMQGQSPVEVALAFFLWPRLWIMG